MADIATGNNTYTPLRGRTQWGAIWAGLFSFVAIWSVFGLLGEAIFAGLANPGTPKPVSGANPGMGIWAIVLTIIAMYIGGKVTGRLASVTDRADAIVHGMTMFGLTVISAVVVLVLAGAALSFGTGISGTTPGSILSVFSGLGWWGFTLLFLGWAAVLGGSASEVQIVKKVTEDSKNVRDIRAA